MHENHPGVQVNIIVSMYFPLWFFIWLLIVQDRSHIGLHWHVSSRRCNKLFFCCRTWHVILSWKLSRNVNVNLFLHRHVPHFYLWQAYCCSSVSLHTPCSIAILISLYIPCTSSVSLHIPCSLSHDNVFFASIHLICWCCKNLEYQNCPSTLLWYEVSVQNAYCHLKSSKLEKWHWLAFIWFY